MPYIVRTWRARLDPLIDPIVTYIRTMHKGAIQEPWHYTNLQSFALVRLGNFMHPKYCKDEHEKWERWGKLIELADGMPGYMTPKRGSGLVEIAHRVQWWRELAPLVISLAGEITKITAETEPLVMLGMLNYCSTEILLRSTREHGKRYHVMELLRAVCQHVNDSLQQRFRLDHGEEDILGRTITQIFISIHDEFYRRVAAPYEDDLIEQKREKNGDTQGYLAWVTPADDGK